MAKRKRKMDKYEEFCAYFEELNEKGISWGMSDLRKKAKELNLYVPSDIDTDTGTGDNY